MEKRNDKGTIIEGKKELIKSEYGTGKYDSDGNPIVNWKLLSEFADKDGFDKRVLIDGVTYKVKMVLPKGTIIIRYGSEMGRFSAPEGTLYEKLALPYKKDTVEFHKYKVINKLKVECLVFMGKVAPGFGSDGGAIQYLHDKTIYESVKHSILERII